MTLSKMHPQALKYKLWFRRHRLFVLLCTFFIFLIFITGLVIVLVKPYVYFALENGITPKFVYQMFATGDNPLRNQDRHTNILILGIPGGTHDGKDLTDTMLVASIRLDKPAKSAFLALPRDIWSPTLRDKINSAYHYGEEKRPGGGLLLAKSIVTEVTGLPMHYALTLDFAEFNKVIDLVGGINVTIEQPFIDSTFPIAGRENDLCNGDPLYRCRYQTIRFERGIEHMNGERALTFARSRHADSDEGTDYARARRQQAVLLALKNKLTTKETLLSFERIKKMFSLYQQSIDTDLNLPDLLYLAKTLRDTDLGSLAHITIPAQGRIQTANDLLIVPTEPKFNGRWVLVPRSGNFTQVKEFINCQLELAICPVKLPQS